MSAWDRYLARCAPDGTHRLFPEWSVYGVWEFIRSDGLHTAHKAESPHCGWRDTVEWSMALADERIPLGAPLPPGMRTRDDPLYTILEEDGDE